MIPLSLSTDKIPETRATLYCSVSERLKDAAQKASDVFIHLAEQAAAEPSWHSAWQVQYRSKRAAEKAADILRALRRQAGNDGSGAVNPLQAPVDSDGARLQCTVGEYLANGAVVKVEKHLKKLSQMYTQLFEPSHITEDPEIGVASRAGAPMLRNDVAVSHHVVIDFLRLFVSLCSSEKPAATYSDHPQHQVTIEDLSTIVVDGVPMNFHIARKAALFTIAILGTGDVSVEEFTRFYNGDTSGDRAAINYSNVFGQAMHGLGKSLVYLRVLKPIPRRRIIRGLIINSHLDDRSLAEWLQEWRPRRSRLPI
jgi:hypothetical protein